MRVIQLPNGRAYFPDKIYDPLETDPYMWGVLIAFDLWVQAWKEGEEPPTDRNAILGNLRGWQPDECAQIIFGFLDAYELTDLILQAKEGYKTCPE